MVFGSHVKTCAMYSIPPWPSLAASTAAYRRRSFSDNHPKKRCIFSSISAEYTSMLDSLSQNLCCRKDTTAQVCREVILDHILRSRRKITFPNLRYCCTILGERVPCFAWEYLGAVVRYRFPMGIETRPF